MPKKLLIFLTWPLCCFFCAARAQTAGPTLSARTPSGVTSSGFVLRVDPAAKDTTEHPERLGLQQHFPNRATCYQYIQGIPKLLQSEGYIAASVDSVHMDSTFARIVLYAGRKYRWGTLVNRVDPYILDQVRASDNRIWTRPVDWKAVQDLETKVLDYCGQHGYPFAQVQLDSVRIQDDAIYAVLRLDKGFIYRIDSLRVFGKVKINKDFLSRYLEIPDGSPYDQSKLDAINSRILVLPFVDQEHPWKLEMLSTGSVLDLYLKPKKNNQIDGMIGILPTTAADGTSVTQVVGELKLQLENAFGNGEGLSINWQELQPQSPRLDLNFNQPYLFRSPVGGEANFDLLKKDSSYVNLNFNLGATWMVSARENVKFYFSVFSSSLLDVDTATILATQQLPDQLDMTIASIGMQYDWRNTNYQYNPTKGNEFSLQLQVGEQHIRENSAITQLQDSTGFNYASLYDTLPLTSYQLKGVLSAAHYFHTAKQSVLKTGLSAGWQLSPRLYTNELFQIGGYKLLRGFDEESIYSSQYVVATLEYRILFGLNSYFFGFTDGAWVQDKSEDINTNGLFMGVGFGINLESKAGMFNISFAEGKGNGENFNFGDTKVHIGYVNFF